jgi:HSP20 family protein
MFDEAFRSFDIGSFGLSAMTGWPSVEFNETEKEVNIVAELPGLDQKLSDGLLTISAERHPFRNGPRHLPGEHSHAFAVYVV